MTINLINLSDDKKFFSQLNNEFIPMGSCNVTSAVMALKASNIPFDYPKNQRPSDYLYQLLQTKESYDMMDRLAPWAKPGGFPPEQVHVMLAWGVNKLTGYDCAKFTQKITLQELIYNLFALKTAAVVTGKFTSYGHMVTLVGVETKQRENQITKPTDVDLTKVKNFIVDDPYGDWHTKYKDQNGNDIKFTFEQFNDLTRNYNADDAKWAHVYTRRITNSNTAGFNE